MSSSLPLDLLDVLLYLDFVKRINGISQGNKKLCKADMSVLKDLHDFSSSGYYGGEMTNLVEREYSNITKNTI